MTGMIGRPGAGLLPLRGHSNVQGVGTMGVVPELKPEMAQSLIEHFGISIPEKKGFDTFASMQKAYNGEIDFAVLLGGNLYSSNPDSNRASKSLSNIPFKCFISTTLNLGHFNGTGEETLILPVRTRDEEKQFTSQESMFNFVRLSLGGRKAPDQNLPSETSLFADIGLKMFGEKPIPWSELHDHKRIRHHISKTVPGMQAISQIENGNDFTIEGRIKHQPKFSTADGKAILATVKAVDARPENNFFNMTTIRSEGQFNSIIYEDEDVYRGVQHRDVIFVNKEDMQKMKLFENQDVFVESKIGKLKVKVVEGHIRQGNVAMYWPEANEIVPGILDPLSKTPSFKRISVKINPV
jgi:anaerobic selenocysteine-containing dehydrogenase